MLIYAFFLILFRFVNGNSYCFLKTKCFSVLTKHSLLLYQAPLTKVLSFVSIANQNDSGKLQHHNFKVIHKINQFRSVHLHKTIATVDIYGLLGILQAFSSLLCLRSKLQKILQEISLLWIDRDFASFLNL